MLSPMRSRLLTAGSVAAVALFASTAAATAHTHRHNRRHDHPQSTRFTASVLVNGASLSHAIPGGSEPLSKPDDISSLGEHIFVGFQNGVGPQGEASSSGNLDSTIVEFNRNGDELAQWDIAGKADGVTADPQTGQVIVTVNEDANSSIYLINPQPGSTPVQYHLQPAAALKRRD